MEVSVAVVKFKLCSSISVIFDQKDWFPDNLSYCLLVFSGQIVKHSWRYLRENYGLTWLRFCIFRIHNVRGIQALARREASASAG